MSQLAKFEGFILGILRAFLFYKIKIMKRGTNTKQALLNAFEKSETQAIGDVCRIAKIAPSTYYFHTYKDSDFRRQVMQKRMEFLAEKINEGEK
jgi:hypothetical protein